MTPLSDDRLYDAVNILLLMQNATGGYATCEKTRGSHFFEYFNASEVGDTSALAFSVTHIETHTHRPRSHQHFSALLLTGRFLAKS